MNAEPDLYEQISKLKKDQFKIQLMLEELNGLIKDSSKFQGAATGELSERLDGLLKNHSEFAELRKENQRLENDVVEWKKRSIEFLVAIENALSNPDLDKMYRNSLEKSYKDFSRIITPMGLEVIRPEPGDSFDDRVHQAVGETQPGSSTICICTTWGFKSGDHILKPAQVVLGDAPEQPVKQETLVHSVKSHTPPPVADGRRRYKNGLLICNVIMSGVLLILAAGIGYKAIIMDSFSADRSEISQEPGSDSIAAFPQNYQLQEKFDALDEKIKTIIGKLDSLSVKPSEFLQIDEKKSKIQGIQYVVKKGDTLWSISRKFFSDGARYTEIMRSNGLRSEKLHPGMILLIPMNVEF